METDFRATLVLTEPEAQTQKHDVMPYVTPKGEKMLSVAVSSVLTVADVEFASITLQKDLMKQMDDYLVGQEDGGKIWVLHYSEQDKLRMTTDPVIELRLTKSGRRKLLEFTKSNIRRQLAIIGNGHILQSSFIMEPITSGKLQILSPTNNVNEMAKFIEGMGLKLHVESATK